MKLTVCNAGNFKLDGGAMFGVVPKSIWQKSNPADENNMCSWKMRCLLIEQGDRLMLIDCGMGDKQSEKFYSYYYMHGDDSLLGGIKAAGYSPDEVTDVFLTHLHFDHCGGAISLNRDKNLYYPTFKNATYWSNKAHWNWATNPNPREKASFLKENLLPIQESGQLKFLDDSNMWLSEAFPNIDVFFANGHTEKQMIPVINYNGKKLAFMADLLPSTGHIPLPYVMGYDVRPLDTLKEKEYFLNKALEDNFTLYLEHDYYNDCCTLKSENGRIKLGKTFSLNDFSSM
jgi:glyoxylase-like metal-dependent hydrolase (beta-lactamase superfamily II)